MHLPEFDACQMHSAVWASGIGRIKILCVCIGFVFNTWINPDKFAKINVNVLQTVFAIIRVFIIN